MDHDNEPSFSDFRSFDDDDSVEEKLDRIEGLVETLELKIDKLETTLMWLGIIALFGAYYIYSIDAKLAP